MSGSRPVTSSKLQLNFIVEQMDGFQIDILSVYNDKLLVSRSALSELFILDQEGHHLSTISVEGPNNLRDATWTPMGNIIYTAWGDNKLVLMSGSGEVITKHPELPDPLCLHVSIDGIIYLTDLKAGDYQSTDDGVTWSLVFKTVEGYQCMQVVKVSADNSDDYWCIEWNCENNDFLLRVYSVDKKLSDDNITWKAIDAVTANGKPINLSGSILSCDGKKSIFLSERDKMFVHVFAVNGQYHCRLLSPNNINNEPRRLAVDVERQLLYVGQRGAEVTIFKYDKGE